MDILELIQQGESTNLEFKGADTRPESLAREMVAFSNTLGGTILLGVDDNGSICGLKDVQNEEWIANISYNSVNPSISPEIKIQEFDGKKIAIINISKGKYKPYQTLDGKFWIRIGSTNRTATKEELSRLFQEAGLVHFDSSPIENTSIEDLDEKILDEYWNTHYRINYFQLQGVEKRKLLLNASIMMEWEDQFVCTVAGVLIFGRYPQQKMLNASIVFASFGGTSITDPLLDKKEIGGTLPEQIEQIQSLLKLLIPIPSEVVGFQRKERPEISTQVLRESMINAVMHRDYSIRTKKISVYLFQDRLQVSSPGRIANTLNLEKIKVGNSAPRNFLLLKFMDNLRYIDGLGRGIPMIIREMGERVRFEEFGDEFRVTIFRK